MPDVAVPIPTQPQAQSLAPRFSYLSSRAGSATRLTLAGELDLAAAPQLEAALDHARKRYTLVIVDLRPLGFMDLSGVHVLLRAHRALRDARGRLVVIRGAAAVDRCLRLAGAEDQLDLVSFGAARTVPETA